MKTREDKQKIGQILKQYRATSNWPGLVLIMLDLAGFLASFLGTCLVGPWWLKLVGGVVTGIFIGRLFQLAHTISHGAMLATGNRRWRRPLGVLCFLPAWTPEWAWDVGHNKVHHVQVQRFETDNTWVPMSPQQYEAASPARRWLERLYRSIFGFGAYYTIESWFLGMIRTSLKNLQHQRIRTDFAALVLFVVLQVVLALWLGETPLQNLFFAVLLPQLVWNYIMGMVVYFHHTHEGAIWYRDGDEGRPSLMEAQWEASRNVTLPWRLDLLMHNVMVHVVHHLAPMVPCYKQKEATRAIEEALGVEIPTHRIGWKRAWQITRHCKLWDFEQQCWVPFPKRVASVADGMKHPPQAAE